MAKREIPQFLKETKERGALMAAEDRQVESRRSVERGERSSMPLSTIKLRESDTRNLNKKHVRALKESIATLGLIEPLALDLENVILAGGHRHAALELLSGENPQVFAEKFPDGMIPVRVMPFTASENPKLALEVEIAENEQRRDYTPAEVKAIANRLRVAGYEDVKGRPKKSQKPLMPALSVVVGKNIRTIQRYLRDDDPKSTTDVALYLKKAKRSLEKWQKNVDSKDASPELIERLPEILTLLEVAISDSTE